MANVLSKKLMEKMSDIDRKTHEFSKERIPEFFGPISLSLSFRSPEAGFFRLVAFLYAITHENLSKINVDFLTEKCEVYLGDSTIIIDNIRKINAIRTVFQHNINGESESSRKKVYIFEDWVTDVVHKKDNLRREDWRTCSKQLLVEFLDVLHLFERTISYLLSLEEDLVEIIVDDWKSKISNEYPVSRFHEIVNQVFINFGLPELDVKRFCQRYHKAWQRELGELSTFDFTSYVTKIVERELMKDFAARNLPLPIDGTDLIEYFDLSPGPLVRELLMKAQERYITSPCSRDELLNHLKSDRK